MSVTFKDFSPKVKAQMEQNIKAALTGMGEEYKKIEPQEIMAQPKFGPGAGGMGAVDTEEMLNSGDFELAGDRAVAVGNRSAHGIFVAVGTWKMPQRPFVQNSVFSHISRYVQVAKTHLSKGF